MSITHKSIMLGISTLSEDDGGGSGHSLSARDSRHHRHASSEESHCGVDGIGTVVVPPLRNR